MHLPDVFNFLDAVIFKRRDSSTESNEPASSLLPQYSPNYTSQQSINQARVTNTQNVANQRSRRFLNYEAQHVLTRPSNEHQKSLKRTEELSKRPPAPIPPVCTTNRTNQHGR